MKPACPADRKRDRRRWPRAYFAEPPHCSIRQVGDALVTNASAEGLCIYLPGSSPKRGGAVSGSVWAPSGPLDFDGRIIESNGSHQRLQVIPQDREAWVRALDSAVACEHDNWHAGIVESVRGIVRVRGSLSGHLRREILHAARAGHGGALDLAEVRHYTVAGIALCIMVCERYQANILRCSPVLERVLPHITGVCVERCRSTSDVCRQGLPRVPMALQARSGALRGSEVVR